MHRKSAGLRKALAWLGVFFLTGFLIIHVWKDLQADVAAWYFHSTPVWLMVMGLASLIYFWRLRQLRTNGVDLVERFGRLPEE